MLSSFFLSIYNYRTFFLIYSSEDYVEMAKAKGLPARDVERRYILRPTLPNIITNFALLIITLWTGATITETVFLWPGLGRTLYQAIGLYDIPIIVGSTIIYAYLLAMTVFLLDFIYALVDPRVKVGGSNMNTLKNSFQNLLYYPSAIVGMLVVFLLVFTAVYAMIKIPYKKRSACGAAARMSGIRIQSLLRRPGSIFFRAKNMLNRLPSGPPMGQ